jgi:hypothetical protein
MRKLSYVFVLSALLAIALSFPAGVSGADKKNAPPAPLPAQITAAQKVFISNGGQDASFSAFTGRRAYDEFYPAVQALERPSLVESPSEADLIFEISLVNELQPFGDELRSQPVLKLTIIDSKTHTKLWVCEEELGLGNFVVVGARQDSKFDKAMGRIVDDLKSLLGKTAAARKS